ncbi:MAG: ATPase domain-containing protein [Candidatus Micrarchaeia archaeon]|jgi:circadian clock protein KaiC
MAKKKAEAGAGNGEYIFTGIAGLDSMLGKGIPTGASVLVEGGPGSGKTMFCLAIALHYCRMGKKVLYMSFEEPEKRLIQHLEVLDKGAARYTQNGQLRMQRFNALDVARSVEALLSQAKKELLIEVDPVFFPSDFKPDLVLVDSLTSISSAFSGEESRFRIYMEQLFRYLEKENISSFLIREVANPSHTGQSHLEAGEAVSFLSDGIIVIYNVLYPSGDRGAGIEILKMRGTQIDRKIVEMTLGAKGITVYPDRRVPKNCTLT